LEVAKMVTVNERTITTDDTRSHVGLLGDQVKQDIAEVLQEFGAPEMEPAAEQVVARPQMTFGYGIPMAGVRYYSFSHEA